MKYKEVFEYERTKSIVERINDVSQFINSLNLSVDENDILVAKLTACQWITEKEMFFQGVDTALGKRKETEIGG